ncbi:hypothetical protein BBP40_008335 [Aspergillus hancockii]|nr:hypothetical protein BBP40_008335 [Aspergillus hancockii]
MATLDISGGHPLAFILFTVILATVFLLHYRQSGSQPASSSSKPLPSTPPADKIIGLRVYPIKSCRGFDIKSAYLFRTGLDLDRNWMFISTETREFLTIRSNSNMTLIRTAFDAETDTLNIFIKEHKIVEIPAHPTTEWLRSNTELKKAGIWGEQTDAWEYKASLTQPFSDFLHRDVRLLYKGPRPRTLRGCGAPKLLGRTAATNFADMMPVLVVSMASIEELNKRLVSSGDKEIEIERFRPNIIIRGSEPWNEDGWKTLRLNDGEGALELDVVSRCLRCQVPNVNPETADKHPRQPWEQLMKYRRIDPGFKFKPAFGMLCVPREEGFVEVGMKFNVTSMTNDHFFINPMK